MIIINMLNKLFSPQEEIRNDTTINQTNHQTNHQIKQNSWDPLNESGLVLPELINVFKKNHICLIRNKQDLQQLNQLNREIIINNQVELKILSSMFVFNPDLNDNIIFNLNSFIKNIIINMSTIKKISKTHNKVKIINNPSEFINKKMIKFICDLYIIEMQNLLLNKQAIGMLRNDLKVQYEALIKKSTKVEAKITQDINESLLQFCENKLCNYDDDECYINENESGEEDLNTELTEEILDKQTQKKIYNEILNKILSLFRGKNNLDIKYQESENKILSLIYLNQIKNTLYFKNLIYKKFSDILKQKTKYKIIEWIQPFNSNNIESNMFYKQFLINVYNKNNEQKIIEINNTIEDSILDYLRSSQSGGKTAIQTCYKTLNKQNNIQQNNQPNLQLLTSDI